MIIMKTFFIKISFDCCSSLSFGYSDCMDLEYDPFCGSDGNTYLNDCFLNVYNGLGVDRNVSRVTDGACEVNRDYKYLGKGSPSHPIVVYPPPASYQPSQPVGLEAIPYLRVGPLAYPYVVYTTAAPATTVASTATVTLTTTAVPVTITAPRTTDSPTTTAAPATTYAPGAPIPGPAGPVGPVGPVGPPRPVG